MSYRFSSLLLGAFTVLGVFIYEVEPAFISQGCGKSVYTSQSGSISSPGYPRTFPNYTNCKWEIRGGPGSIISVTYDDFDVNPDRNCSSVGVDVASCCTTSWLKIGVPEDPSPMVLCGHGLTPNQYLSVGPVVWVKFRSSRTSPRSGGRGFRLSYIIIRLRDPDPAPVLCRQNETLCSSSLQECHPKCDHVMNCPSGIDEMGCMKGCQGRVMCDSWNGCYTPDERCNGVAQCGDHSDERNCSPEFCRSDRGGFLCANRLCIRESWQCDQTNDCGDSSDEINCLKNSVITAAVMGSLICGLLLVIAVGCTCKLYALRYGGGSDLPGGPHSTLALSPLERELLQREPPPPYSIALSHPPAAYFQTAASVTATTSAVHQVAPPTHHAAGPPTLHHHLLDPYYFTRLCRTSHHRRSRRLRRQRQPLPGATLPRYLVVTAPNGPSSEPSAPSQQPPPYTEARSSRDKTPTAAVRPLPTFVPPTDSAPDSTASSSYSSTTTLLSSSGGTSSTDLSMDDALPVVFRSGEPTADVDNRPLLVEDE